MLRRTWPYGTRLNATVVQVDPIKGGQMVTLVDQKGEGHIIVGGRHALTPTPKQKVVMQFMKGGANGGWWKIVREVK